MIRGWEGFSARFVCIVVCLTSTVSSCGRSPRTPYNGDPAVPLFELNTADYCKPQQSKDYSEDLISISGEKPDGSYGFAQGGGCIKRSILDAWGVLHNQDLMKWDGVTKMSFKKGEPPKKTTHFYEVRYVVSDILTVRWTMQWYHTVGFGTREAPQLLWVNYKRVAGDPNVDYWEGTIYLQEVEPGVTAFAMRDQIHRDLDPRDPNDSLENSSKGSVSDVFGKVKTGQSVPIP